MMRCTDGDAEADVTVTAEASGVRGPRRSRSCDPSHMAAGDSSQSGLGLALAAQPLNRTPQPPRYSGAA